MKRILMILIITIMSISYIQSQTCIEYNSEPITIIKNSKWNIVHHANFYENTTISLMYITIHKGTEQLLLDKNDIKMLIYFMEHITSEKNLKFYTVGKGDIISNFEMIIKNQKITIMIHSGKLNSPNVYINIQPERLNDFKMFIAKSYRLMK